MVVAARCWWQREKSENAMLIGSRECFALINQLVVVLVILFRFDVYSVVRATRNH